MGVARGVTGRAVRRVWEKGGEGHESALWGRACVARNRRNHRPNACFPLMQPLTTTSGRPGTRHGRTSVAKHDDIMRRCTGPDHFNARSANKLLDLEAPIKARTLDPAPTGSVDIRRLGTQTFERVRLERPRTCWLPLQVAKQTSGHR